MKYCEEDRAGMRLSESCFFGGEGPEEIHHAPRQRADRGEGDQAAGAQLRGVTGLVVGQRQRPLRREDQDVVGRRAVRDQPVQPRRSRRRLARPCRPCDKELPVERCLNERLLRE